MDWVMAPLFLQAAVMAVDEGLFHRRRKLPKWERWGHPLDTLSLLVLVGFVWLVPPSKVALTWFTVLAVFSCLFVTKDEWVHADLCSKGEHWLHAVLFLLHPLSCLAIFFAWQSGFSTGERELPFVLFALGCLMFFIYQVGYWNVLRKDAHQH